MDRRRTLAQALADCAWLAGHRRHLVMARIPGTARPCRQADLDPARRAELDREARAERRERVDIAPGETAAPVWVDVLDVLADLTAGADLLGETLYLAVGGHGPWRHAGAAYSDYRPHLGYVAAALPDVDEDMLAWAARRLARLKRGAAVALRMVYDGQRVGACPWCRADRALVVRLTADGDPLIVCESDRVCEPPASDCGVYVRGFPPRPCEGRERGRPAWRWTDWEWLGQRIRREEAGQVAFLAPARPVKVYCAPNGCRLWQGASADTPGPGLPRTCGRADCVAPRHIVRAAAMAGA
jgi:hypothetical protein